MQTPKKTEENNEREGKAPEKLIDVSPVCIHNKLFRRSVKRCKIKEEEKQEKKRKWSTDHKTIHSKNKPDMTYGECIIDVFM